MIAAPQAVAGRRDRFWTALDIVVFAVGIRVAARQPVALLGGNHDDFHYVQIANALLHGHWLGQFEQLTLATGPFYPLFLALVATLAIPIQIATEGVYLLGCLVLARAAGTVSDNRPAATFCFAVLALNPVPFDYSAMALRREPLYDGLTVLVLGLAARVFLCPSARWWSILLGCAGAAFCLTREEGIVLAPALCVMVLWRVWPERRWGAGIHGLVRSIRLSRDSLIAIAIPVIAWVIPMLLVAGINGAVYGVFRTNDFQSGPFADAYGALSRIRQDHWQRFVPVPRDARIRAYAASDAARELQPFLEGDIGRYWTTIGCANHPIPGCADMQGGWFMWALRDSVAAAGHYGSAEDADHFFRKLAGQINSACNAQSIPCGGFRSGYLPPFRLDYLGPLLHSTRRVVNHVLSLGPVVATARMITAQGPDTEPYRRLVFGSPVVPQGVFSDAAGWRIAGWFVGDDPSMILSVTARPGTAVQSDLRFFPDPVLPTVLHRDASISLRFTAEVRCQPADCGLQVTRGETIVGTWPIQTLGVGQLLDRPEAAAYIDLVTPLPTYFAEFSQPTPRTRVVEGLARLMPWLTTAGLPVAMLWVGWIVLGDLRRHRFRPLTALALATALAIIARIGLLAVLDATAFDTEFRYEAPVMTLSLFLVSLMLPAVFSAYHGIRVQPVRDA